MPPPKPTAVVLSKLGRVRRSGDGWTASCPVAENHKHGDRKPSLTVGEGADGRVLVNCQKGTCSFEEICAAMGLEPTDLFPPEAQDSTGRVCIAEYVYTDENGAVLYVKERLWPKSFRYRRPDGKGGWVWKLGRVRRPLYRLPTVLAAKAEGRTIYFVEGERDVHTLEALGEVATTAGGAKDFRPEHAATLDGATVVVIADTDEGGRKLAAAVGQATGGKVMEPAQGTDVTEHLRAGLTLDDLVEGGTRPVLEVLPGGKPDLTDALVLGVRDGDAVIGEARLPDFEPMLTFEGWRPRFERTGVHAEVRLLVNGQIVAYSTINVSRHEDRTKLANLAAENLGDKAMGKSIRLRLDHFCAQLWDWWIAGSGSAVERVMPGDETLHFTMEPFIIEGGGTILFAPPGKGKSWTGMLWSMALTYGLNPWATEPKRVMYVNLERPPKTLRRRMMMLGNVLGVPDPELRFFHARGQTMKDHLDPIRNDIDRHGIDLVVLDSLSRTGAGDLNSNQSANETMDMLNSTNISWVALAHTPKHAPGIFGSRMFEAAADVTVSLTPAHSPEGTTLGTHLEIDKANDLPRFKGQTWAYEFSGYDLTAVREARPNEFPDLNVPRSSTEQVIAALEMEGSLTVSAICEATDLAKTTVYRILKNPKFIKAGSGWGLLAALGAEE